METKLNSQGYYLYDVSGHEWIFHVKGGPVYSGTFREVVEKAISIGFCLSEIEIAVDEMLKYSHNGAHFGAYMGFIYSFHKDFKDNRQAS